MPRNASRWSFAVSGAVECASRSLASTPGGMMVSGLSTCVVYVSSTASGPDGTTSIVTVAGADASPAPSTTKYVKLSRPAKSTPGV